MRQIFVSMILLVAFTQISCKSEDEVATEAQNYLEKQAYPEALELIDSNIERLGSPDSLVHLRYRALLALERHEEALETFETILERKGSSPDIVIDKVRLLVKLNRLDEALDVAIAADEKSTKKSPYLSSIVCKIYTQNGEVEPALDWMEVSMDRGDTGFAYYQGEEFETLHQVERFHELIDEMKRRTGIGLPAKDLKMTLMSGSACTLSDFAGSVVLVDFWATWCPPCVAEFPRLKDLYEELSENSFEILAVSLDTDRTRVERFLSERTPKWKTGFSGEGMEDPAARIYGVDSAPRYFVIDRQGILRAALESGGDPLEQAIRELVEEGKDSL